MAEVERQGRGRRRRRGAARARRRSGPGARWRPPTGTRLLRRFAEQVDAHADELALLETRNVGKPIADSRGEVSMVADVLRFYAGAVDKHTGTTIPVSGGVDMTWHEPLGVVAAIVPWNFPIAITSWKVAPALACGNTVVVKPAQLTPLTALRLAELALDAGIPEGVLQVVVGSGTDGGVRSGRAPRRGQGVVHGLDRGGARRHGPRRGHRQAGHARARREVGQRRLRRRRSRARGRQRARRPSSATPGRTAVPASRILVERSAFDRFVELLVAATEALVVGDPEDPATEMGPLVSAEHRALVSSVRRPARRRHAGGRAQHRPPTAPGGGSRRRCSRPSRPTGGCGARRSSARSWRSPPSTTRRTPWLSPTTPPTGCRDRSGPVTSGRAMRMARAVHAGVLSVNSNTSVRVNAPFGGMKQSGFGRELGMEALASFSDVKNVFVSTE